MNLRPRPGNLRAVFTLILLAAPLLPAQAPPPVSAALREKVPTCKVLIVTTFGRAGYLRRAMEAGALGFVVKDAPAEQLADARRGRDVEEAVDGRASQVEVGMSPRGHQRASKRFAAMFAWRPHSCVLPASHEQRFTRTTIE